MVSTSFGPCFFCGDWPQVTPSSGERLLALPPLDEDSAMMIVRRSVTRVRFQSSPRFTSLRNLRREFAGMYRADVKMRGESLRATTCHEVFAKNNQLDSSEGENLDVILRCVFLVTCLNGFFTFVHLPLIWTWAVKERGAAPPAPPLSKGYPPVLDAR